jgi:hypothetical protein
MATTNTAASTTGADNRIETVQIARQLGLEIFVHDRNYGYGANQKTSYREAVRAGADIVVMVHPD